MLARAVKESSAMLRYAQLKLHRTDLYREECVYSYSSVYSYEAFCHLKYSSRQVMSILINLLHCHNKANTLQLLCNENIHLEAKILIKNEVGTSNISCVWVSDTFKSNV